ncbi:toll/interleukin-1 receptor domain-containing protein [Phenylobacterium sp.]|jgi:hypothetical protein|uniref:toll/interleukin-1 receptor domain-containing protein n=1 Tax=Phenylobacterium sp. TaxID=1871053 RepID=UPI002F3E2E82
MSASIFISFAAPDRKVASTLCKALESRGFRCWFSSRDILPGENFQVAIVRAIRKAKILLLVFTANSNASEEMTKELALASQERLIVVPLRVEDVAPNEAFAYEFATRQWIDFFADWEAAIDQLSERLAQALPGQAQPDPVLAAAKAEAPELRERAAPSPVKVEALAAMEPPAPVAPPAPPPKAAAPPPPKPKPEPPPAADAPVLVRDTIGAEAPLAAADSSDAHPAAPRKRAGMLAVAAVVLVALIGLGLASPALFGRKPQAKTGLATAAAASPRPVAAVQPAEAVALQPEAAAETAPEPVKAAPRPKRKAAPKPTVDDVPY